jgi:hypothetical protein
MMRTRLSPAGGVSAGVIGVVPTAGTVPLGVEVPTVIVVDASAVASGVVTAPVIGAVDVEDAAFGSDEMVGVEVLATDGDDVASTSAKTGLTKNSAVRISAVTQISMWDERTFTFAII